MYNYVPRSGTIQIPSWVFREFKSLFIVPRRLLQGNSVPMKAATGNVAHLEKRVLDDDTDNNLASLGLVIQITLDSSPGAHPQGQYKVSSLLDDVMIQCFNDKYENCTWYFRPETLFIQNVS